MNVLALALGVIASNPDSVVLEERIDLFDPTTGAFLGSEVTYFGPDGRRLRLVATDSVGTPSLLFFVLHDEQGRESEAIYFEGGPEAYRETFTYSEDGRLRTTTYFYEPGVAADRAESDLDERGREISKRYYRANGTQYGEEDVLWAEGGNKLGWDFNYVERDGGASFRYDYTQFAAAGDWLRRVRSRDGAPERVEVRSVITATPDWPSATPARFQPGTISSDRSETSPSFSRDGKTMVFARYDDDWYSKDPFIAYLEKDGWRVEPIDVIGRVYNLAISPDGATLFYATRSDEERELFRLRKTDVGWFPPESLSKEYGLVGTYPCLTDGGDLFFFDSDAPSGAGIYSATSEGDGFARAESVYVPGSDDPFDGYSADGRTLLVTRCFDQACDSGSENGIWQVELSGADAGEARKLPRVPYSWGAQPVESLGLFVFTDGDDILAIPLTVAGLGG